MANKGESAGIYNRKQEQRIATNERRRKEKKNKKIANTFKVHRADGSYVTISRSEVETYLKAVLKGSKNVNVAIAEIIGNKDNTFFLNVAQIVQLTREGWINPSRAKAEVLKASSLQRAAYLETAKGDYQGYEARANRSANELYSAYHTVRAYIKKNNGGKLTAAESKAAGGTDTGYGVNYEYWIGDRNANLKLLEKTKGTDYVNEQLKYSPVKAEKTTYANGYNSATPINYYNSKKIKDYQPKGMYTNGVDGTVDDYIGDTNVNPNRKTLRKQNTSNTQTQQPVQNKQVKTNTSVQNKPKQVVQQRQALPVNPITGLPSTDISPDELQQLIDIQNEGGLTDQDLSVLESLQQNQYATPEQIAASMYGDPTATMMYNNNYPFQQAEQPINPVLQEAIASAQANGTITPEEAYESFAAMEAPFNPTRLNVPNPITGNMDNTAFMDMDAYTTPEDIIRSSGDPNAKPYEYPGDPLANQAAFILGGMQEMGNMVSPKETAEDMAHKQKRADEIASDERYQAKMNEYNKGYEEYKKTDAFKKNNEEFMKKIDTLESHKDRMALYEEFRKNNKGYGPQVFDYGGSLQGSNFLRSDWGSQVAHSISPFANTGSLWDYINSPYNSYPDMNRASASEQLIQQMDSAVKSAEYSNDKEWYDSRTQARISPDLGIKPYPYSFKETGDYLQAGGNPLYKRSLYEYDKNTIHNNYTDLVNRKNETVNSLEKGLEKGYKEAMDKRKNKTVDYFKVQKDGSVQFEKNGRLYKHDPKSGNTYVYGGIQLDKADGIQKATKLYKTINTKTGKQVTTNAYEEDAIQDPKKEIAFINKVMKENTKQSSKKQEQKKKQTNDGGTKYSYDTAMDNDAKPTQNTKQASSSFDPRGLNQIQFNSPYAKNFFTTRQSSYMTDRIGQYLTRSQKSQKYDLGGPFGSSWGNWSTPRFNNPFKNPLSAFGEPTFEELAAQVHARSAAMGIIPTPVEAEAVAVSNTSPNTNTTRRGGRKSASKKSGNSAKKDTTTTQLTTEQQKLMDANTEFVRQENAKNGTKYKTVDEAYDAMIKGPIYTGAPTPSEINMPTMQNFFDKEAWYNGLSDEQKAKYDQLEQAGYTAPYNPNFWERTKDFMGSGFNLTNDQLEKAPIYGNLAAVAADIFGLRNKNDFTEAEMLEDYANGLSAQTVTYNPNYNYATYNPTNLNSATDALLGANSGVVANLNNTGAGAAERMAATLQNNKNLFTSMGSVVNQINQANNTEKNNVRGINNAIDAQNAQQSMQAQQFNASARQTIDAQRLSALQQALALRLKERETNAAAKAADLNTLFNNMFQLGRNNKNLAAAQSIGQMQGYGFNESEGGLVYTQPKTTKKEGEG
jgi:hypothetical protein